MIVRFTCIVLICFFSASLKAKAPKRLLMLINDLPQQHYLGQVKHQKCASCHSGHQLTQCWTGAARSSIYHSIKKTLAAFNALLH